MFSKRFSAQGKLWHATKQERVTGRKAGNGIAFERTQMSDEAKKTSKQLL